MHTFTYHGSELRCTCGNFPEWKGFTFVGEGEDPTELTRCEGCGTVLPYADIPDAGDAVDWLDRDAVADLVPELSDRVAFNAGAGFGFFVSLPDGSQIMLGASQTEAEFFVGRLLSDEVADEEGDWAMTADELFTNDRGAAVAAFRSLVARYGVTA